MKILKALALAIVLILNVCSVQPALADRPPIDKNPDYLTITQSLTELTKAQQDNTLPEGMTPAEVSQQINQLKYQKYIIETGEDTTCRNETTQKVAIYGEKPKKSASTFDSIIYLLSPGEETDDDWACQGVYLPNDAKVAGLTIDSASALKILPGTQIVLTENAETGEIEFNLPPANVVKAGEINWEIPDLTQADLNSQFPNAPVD
ncbi:hypothetical protein QQ054_06285 [Oscillatoria amoena NRMC-F 0135]|nr:hypothetical protein [Geitlerinema splendidum]MDL5045644.1 hypothetical protein [Oscillatoria amoena NRMC-F 0135]